jgi:dihydrofolate reductase
VTPLPQRDLGSSQGKKAREEKYSSITCAMLSTLSKCLVRDQHQRSIIMRKVVAGLFITLDGVVEAPYKWQEQFDEEMGEAMMEQLSSQDTVLLGRVTYQEWAPYWPTATDEPFASFINSTPKYVFSTTLDNVEEWQNSTLIKGDLTQEIARLKQLPGKNIGTAGSPSLVYSLLEQGLLDELILLVHPVVAGSGKRLFKDEGDLKRLNLLSSKTSRTGTVILTYQPREL